MANKYWKTLECLATVRRPNVHVTPRIGLSIKNVRKADLEKKSKFNIIRCKQDSTMTMNQHRCFEKWGESLELGVSCTLRFQARVNQIMSVFDHLTIATRLRLWLALESDLKFGSICTFFITCQWNQEDYLSLEVSDRPFTTSNNLWLTYRSHTWLQITKLLTLFFHFLDPQGA